MDKLVKAKGGKVYYIESGKSEKMGLRFPQL